MVNVDKAVIARMKSHGEHFEILVDCDAALALKQGKEVSMADVLADQKVFTDSKKGMVASEHELVQVFGSSNIDDIAKQIIQKGEIQLTADYRAKMLEEKKKRIIQTIRSNAIDPKTNLPIPETRLELAFDEAKIHIDENKDEDVQVKEIVKKLQPILPIKLETKKLRLVIPSQYGGKCQGTIQNMATVVSDAWRNDGSYECVIEIPAGLQQDLFDALNSMTHGSVESEVVQ